MLSPEVAKKCLHPFHEGVFLEIQNLCTREVVNQSGCTNLRISLGAPGSKFGSVHPPSTLGAFWVDFYPRKNAQNFAQVIKISLLKFSDSDRYRVRVTGYSVRAGSSTPGLF